jgi:cell filamentation protein
MNAVHPFRDGNGRSSREFIRALALDAGYVISWEGLTKEETDRAARLSFSRRDNREWAHILDRQIIPMKS